MKPNGTQKNRLYRASCCTELWFTPVWSADGTRVALSANQHPPAGVNQGGTVVVNADGTPTAETGTADGGTGLATHR